MSMKMTTNTQIGAPVQSLVVQESLMTARLENIYDSSLFNSSELPNPSNIVYYNKLMNNSKEWKHEEVKPSQERVESDSAPEVEYYAPKFDSGLEGKVTMRANDPSIHKECEESSDLSDSDAYYEDGDEVENMYSRLRDRKPLGEYATKTIRTVHQSEVASVEESEVLEHGTYNLNFGGPGALKPISLQKRGSVKEHLDDP